MPYSGPGDKSLPANVKKMPAKKKKQWVAVWNSTYSACVEDGGSTTSCETKAFKAANGTVQSIGGLPMPPTATIRKIWNELVQSFREEFLVDEILIGEAEGEEVERAMGFSRMKEKLWTVLESSERTASEWAWPIDIFVDDNGGHFAVVAQSGKLFQIPLTISQDDIELGEWTQVTETFEPVQQTAFRVIRQADGRHRWLGVVASSVLNRVGEIDSKDLFDSFVTDVEQTGNYPRLDFYHLGRYNEKAWEFGTADFHAREDCCYIASGLFDEDHPLAQAAIQAYETDPEKWGFSIEFYAFGEPEVIVVEPEVRVPVYKKGRIVRISIVREADAASLFTRIGNITEEKIRMKRDTVNALAEFFGTDEAAEKFLNSFEVEIDGINRTITDDKLIHRSKETKSEKGVQAKADTKVEAKAEETELDPVIELDEEAMAELTEQVLTSPVFQTIVDGLGVIQKTLDTLLTARETDSAEIAALRTEAKKVAVRLASVEKEETTKKQEYLEDLPARKGRTATFRPREEYATEEDSEDLAQSANRTLAKLPRRY